MHQLLKRLELIKTSIAIEDDEIIELQVMKIQKMMVDDDVKKILFLLENNDFSNALVDIENYLSKFSGVVVYEDKELAGLRLELKALENNLQELSCEKNEYLNDIKEFNTQYHLHLGSLIQKILKLKEEILYASIKAKKDAFEKSKKIYDDAKSEYEELKDELYTKEEELSSIDEFDDSYDELYEEVQAVKDELNEKEKILNEKRKETKRAKEELEEDEVAQEYEDIKQDSQEFEKEYEEIKKEKIIKISDEKRKELKQLYRKASKLCHPDIVAEDLKEQAHKIMVALNEAYGKQDVEKVRELLFSLENGNVFDLSSDSIIDKDMLKSKIVEMRNNIATTKQEIDEIKNEDIFVILQEYDDLEIYFTEQEELLNAEYEKLKNNLENFNKAKTTQHLNDEQVIYNYWSDEF